MNSKAFSCSISALSAGGIPFLSGATTLEGSLEEFSAIPRQVMRLVKHKALSAATSATAFMMVLAKDAAPDAISVRML